MSCHLVLFAFLSLHSVCLVFVDRPLGPMDRNRLTHIVNMAKNAIWWFPKIGVPPNHHPNF